jgi:hypothetical protein
LSKRHRQFDFSDFAPPAACVVVRAELNSANKFQVALKLRRVSGFNLDNSQNHWKTASAEGFTPPCPYYNNGGLFPF